MRRSVVVPELRLHFKGGAEMVFPMENYFAYVGGGAAACLTVVTDGGVEGKGSGPSVIIGNYQMQNFHVEFDLKKQRFGFKQEACN
ncbi:Probable aspartyl protease At4g16563 [Linum perenne]